MMVIVLEEEVTTGMAMNAITMDAGMIGVDIGIMTMGIGN
jgi:hypothetical protein